MSKSFSHQLLSYELRSNIYISGVLIHGAGALGEPSHQRRAPGLHPGVAPQAVKLHPPPLPPLPARLPALTHDVGVASGCDAPNLPRQLYAAAPPGGRHEHNVRIMSDEGTKCSTPVRLMRCLLQVTQMASPINMRGPSVGAYMHTIHGPRLLYMLSQALVSDSMQDEGNDSALDRYRQKRNLGVIQEPWDNGACS